MQSKKPIKIKNRQEFSERFRNLRKELKLSQRELAEKIGLLGNTQICKFEKGTSEPTLETLRMLAKLKPSGYLHNYVDIHELVIGRPSPNTNRWQEKYLFAVELFTKYASSEYSRLLTKRRDLLDMLGQAKERNMNGKGIEDIVSELHKIEGQIKDTTHDLYFISSERRSAFEKSDE